MHATKMIVVDTHAVIWLSQGDHLLSVGARAALIEGRRRGELAIADITLREIAVQVTRSRVAVSAPLEVYLRFIESTYRILPISAQIAARSVLFSPAFPKDPADRLIAATAIVHSSRLMTKDERIRESGEVDCIW